MGLIQEAAKRILGDEFRQIDQVYNNYDLLRERLWELELALEDEGWLPIHGDIEEQFSRDALRKIVRLGRLFYLKNPLVQRGINVQKYYVFGQGINVQAKDEDINEVIQGFMDDDKNKVELTSHQARMMKEAELQIDGNLFFVLFPNSDTGQVRIRTIPFGQIDQVVHNPEDAKEPWYYMRRFMRNTFSPTTGLVIGTEEIIEYYPDWRYLPGDKPGRIAEKEVHWDRPIYHVKVGGFSDWTFGVSEVYAAIDWAKAYKEFLEDWASIVRAYRRFAFKATGLKSKGEIASMKAKMGTTYATGGGATAETRPPPVTGAMALLAEGRDLQPVRTAGATVSAEDGRRILLMVCAATGLPETFFGDVSVGTLATAKSLDRPTELQMRDRQTLWADIHKNLFEYALLQAIKTPSGPLAGLGRVVKEDEDGKTIEHIEWNEDIDPSIDVGFPPLVERDIDTVIDSIADAATLKGFAPADTIKMDDLTRMLLTALGEQNVDEILEEMYPEGWEEREEAEQEQDDEIAKGMEDFKATLERLLEKYAGTAS